LADEFRLTWLRCANWKPEDGLSRLHEILEKVFEIQSFEELGHRYSYSFRETLGGSLLC